MVNRYYFYCVDEDFGPFFLKFCSFPYTRSSASTATKCQLRKRGIVFNAPDKVFAGSKTPLPCNDCALA
jgi:hypothetical protein